MENTTRATSNRAWWAARIVVVLAALTGLGFVAPARAPAAPNKPEVTAVTTQTSALAPGQSAWVSVV